MFDLVQPPSPSGRFLGWAGQAGLAEVGERLRDATTWGINNAGPGPVQSDLPMKTKTHFAFRVDIWDDTGDSIVEHVAEVDDFEVAQATYRAAVARWPAARPHLPASVCHRGGGALSATIAAFRFDNVIGTAFDGMCLSRHFR